MATITVLEARNLISTDPNGLSDPYCIIGVADPQTGKFVDKTGCVRSETKRWTLTPTWKKGILDVNKRPSLVRVEIWDKDEDKEDDFVGLAHLKIDSIQNVEDKWVTLLTKHGKENKLGDIHVTVKIHQSTQGAPTAVPQQTIQKAQTVPVTVQTTAKPPATNIQQTTTPLPTSGIPHLSGKPHPSAVPHPATTIPQPATTAPARPVAATPAPVQATITPSQPATRPTPTTTTPAPITPSQPATRPTPATVQTTSRPAPASTPQPATTARPTPTQAPQHTAPATTRQVSTPSAAKPAQPPANAAEIQRKNSELAQKHVKLAAAYHAQGAIMEALEHYNLSSALYARAFGPGDKRALAADQCATQLMMEISFGAFMA